MLRPPKDRATAAGSLAEIMLSGEALPGNLSSESFSVHQLLRLVASAYDRELKQCHSEIAALKHVLPSLSHISEQRIGSKQCVHNTVQSNARHSPVLRKSESCPLLISSQAPSTDVGSSTTTADDGDRDEICHKDSTGTDKYEMQHLEIPDPQTSPEAVSKASGLLMCLAASDPEIAVRAIFAVWRDFTAKMRTPSTFSLWPVLASKSFDIEESHDLAYVALDTPHEEPEPSEQVEDQPKIKYNKACGHLLIPPGSTGRISWDIAGTFFLAYDCIMIPLSAFGPKKSIITAAFDWCCLVFWTADMLMSCTTGVVVNGVTMMDPGTILRVYARTWFPLDVIVVVPDWIFTLMALGGGGDKGGAQSSGRLLRALRILRTVRLLRLAKLQKILILVRDRIDSEVTFIVINILKLVLMLLALNHFLAALWWSIGSAGQSGDGPNWIDSSGLNDVDLAYRYLTSLHWSICMFTPGSMSVQPVNTAERLFAILILVCGMVVFTSFISSMSASINALKTMNGDKGKDLWMLRRFLRQHNLGQEHSFRILRYVDNAFARLKSQKISSDKVQALKFLTDQLRHEIDYVIHFSCLVEHPLLASIADTAKVTMFHLVGAALSRRPLARNDLLFSAGGSATHMHLVMSGELRYLKTVEFGSNEGQDVMKDDWLCEAVLWTPWSHVGVARAVVPTELVSVKSYGFLEVVCNDAQTMNIVCRYAERYVRELSRTGRGLLSDVSTSKETRDHARKLLDEDYEDKDPDSPRSPKMRKSPFGSSRSGLPPALLQNNLRKVQPEPELDQVGQTGCESMSMGY
jgi:hypothetical protein